MRAKVALDWLKQRWARIVLSFIMAVSGLAVLDGVPWTQWAKIGFIGLLIVAVASWWIGWWEEEK